MIKNMCDKDKIMQQPLEPVMYTLPRIRDQRGNLSFLQDFDQLPFAIERCYWLYDVPGDANRDGHAYYNSQEVIVALCGSFEVLTDMADGSGPRRFRLDRSYNALYVPSMCWREIDNFSTNSIALVISSTMFDEADYIRDYATFVNIKKTNAL